MVRFRHEGAATNTSPGIERSSGCINHRHARPNGAETFGNIPAAGVAAKIDVGEYNVDRRIRMAERDGLFAGHGLDDGVTRFL